MEDRFFYPAWRWGRQYSQRIVGDDEGEGGGRGQGGKGKSAGPTSGRAAGIFLGGFLWDPQEKPGFRQRRPPASASGKAGAFGRWGCGEWRVRVDCSTLEAESFEFAASERE